MRPELQLEVSISALLYSRKKGTIDYIIFSLRTIRKPGFPDPRRQFDRSLRGMLANPLQHIDHITIRIDALHLARGQ